MAKTAKTCPVERLELEKQLPLFDPQSGQLTLQPDRLEHGMPERIYYERWQQLNKRHPAVNSGFTALEWILCPSGSRPGPVSARDAVVAACVIQWLGTNCGMGFIRACEESIAKITEHSSAVERALFMERHFGWPAKFVRPAKPTRQIELDV